jgi:hypothetical protein
MAFCNSVGGVPAEQFIHERVSNPPGRQRWTELMEHPRRVAGTRQQSVLAQIGLTISVSNRPRLEVGSAAIAWSRNGSGRHGSTGSR